MSKIALLRTDVKPDLRSAAMHAFESEPAATSLCRLYPRAFNILALLQPHQDTTAPTPPVPPMVRLGSDWVTPDGVFLVDDGTRLHVWVGSETPQEALAALFGAPNALSMTSSSLTQAFSAALQSGAENVAPICALVGSLAQQRGHSHFSINVSTQAEVSESQLLWQLQIEDKQGSTMSYVDFLCHIHRQIQLKLNP
jgi:protein transport protein SEC24